MSATIAQATRYRNIEFTAGAPVVAAHEAAKARIAEILRPTRWRLTAADPHPDGDPSTPTTAPPSTGTGTAMG